MKALAFHPNVASPPPAIPPAHAASAGPGGEPSFAAVLHGLDTPGAPAKLKGHESDRNADPESIANSGAGSEGKPSRDSSPSIEAALAALGYPTPAPSTVAAGPARTVDNAVPSTRDGDTTRRAVICGGVAPASGGAETLETTSPQNTLFEDPALGFQGVQARTHLALADARPAIAGNYLERPILAQATGAPPAAAEPVTLSISQTQVTQSNGASLADAITPIGGLAGNSAAASPLAAPSPTNILSATPRTKAQPPSQPVFVSLRTHATPARGALGESNAGWHLSGERAQTSGERSQPSSDGPSTATPSVTLATSNAAPATGTAALPPIGINQLADFVATQAASLTAEGAPTTSLQTFANSAPQSVKELEIALDPAELGAVSIKMRLTNGKLTVVIGAANASTRQAIESDRSAILDRLTSNEQPLETLIIQSEGPTQAQAGGNDAYDTSDPGQNPTNGDPANAESDAGGGARNGRGRSGIATLPGAAAISRGRSGDLIV